MTEQDTELGIEAITGIVNAPELAEAQTGQAWSLAEDYPPTGWELPIPPRHRMGWEKPLLAIVLLVSLAAAVITLVVFINQPTSTPAAPQPAPTPAPAPAPMSQDDRFIELLNANYPAGYPFDAPRDGIIKGGHWVCEYLGENHSTDDALTVLDDERKSVPDAAARHQMSEDWLESSLAIYCPEFRTPQTRDDAFVAAIKAIGMAMKNGSEDFSPLITSGRDVCILLGDGHSRNDIVDSIYSVHTEGETKTTAQDFVAVSIKYYCPQYN